MNEKYQKLAVPKNVTLVQIPKISHIYRAGSDGKIYSYSYARTNAKKPKPFRLSDCCSSSGYYLVTLCRNKKRGSFAVHSLICSAFHGPKPFRSACTMHLDGDRLNNRPENLKWGSYAQNEADKRKHGKVANGEKQGSAKLTTEGVRILRKTIPYGLWDSVSAAKAFDVNISTINKIVRGDSWKHVQ